MRSAARVLILPGWQGSGPGHWQSLWQQRYGHTLVEQHDWQRPLRGDWIARLEDVLLQNCSPTQPALLVAHSLGCILVGAWAAHSRNTARVAGALLVAPGDVAQANLSSILPSWLPLPGQTLPFPSVLVGSHNDPYCSLARAQTLAQAWGSDFVDAGALGHLNAESGLGDWPAGYALLQSLMTRKNQAW